jgi:apolipoprotein D and lipocalin family protein
LGLLWGYNVNDKEYKYALVAGGSLNYLWILSREKSIPLEVTSDYLKIAEDIGYKTADLIWVQHTK